MLKLIVFVFIFVALAKGDETMFTRDGFCRSKSLSLVEPVFNTSLIQPVLLLVSNSTLREQILQNARDKFKESSNKFTSMAKNSMCLPSPPNNKRITRGIHTAAMTPGERLSNKVPANAIFSSSLTTSRYPDSPPNYKRYPRGILSAAMTSGTQLMKLFKYSKLGSRIPTRGIVASSIKKVGGKSKWDIFFTLFGIGVGIHQEWEISKSKSAITELQNDKQKMQLEIDGLKTQNSLLSEVFLQEIVQREVNEFFVKLDSKLSGLVIEARPNAQAASAEVECTNEKITVTECFTYGSTKNNPFDFTPLEIKHLNVEQLEALKNIVTQSPPTVPPSPAPKIKSADNWILYGLIIIGLIVLTILVASSIVAVVKVFKIISSIMPIATPPPEQVPMQPIQAYFQ